jgi:hypothetical protein
MAECIQLQTEFKYKRQNVLISASFFKKKKLPVPLAWRVVLLLASFLMW